MPSEIAFQIGMFPDNLPLPSHKSSARLIGGIMHLLHFCIRISQIQRIPDSDLGWEDMFHEGDSGSWFDWVRLIVFSFLFPQDDDGLITAKTVVMTGVLIVTAISNAIYLFSRTRIYHLSLQPTTLVSSPNAKFVSTVTDPPPPPSMPSRLWRAFILFWRFLLNLPASNSSNTAKFSKTQQLEVWSPGELEKELFLIYSPASCLLWMATNSANWILMFTIMTLVQLQVRLPPRLRRILLITPKQLSTLTHTFQTLIKDKEIIASEVMHEYDEKVRLVLHHFSSIHSSNRNQFVIPRVNPVRRDVAVMTHQAEVFDVWNS
jgi:Protein of unknown function (DUF2418)